MPPYIASEVAAEVGAWGSPSSTLDWCEENYALNHYIAEFWNTLSNAAMILPSLVGLWTCAMYSLEVRYYLCYFALFVVGVGSVLFHGTLLYTMQLLDELPMLILSALMLYALYEMGMQRGVKTSSTYVKLSLLVAYTSIVSVVYVIVNDPTFHEVAYGVMVFGLIVHGFHALRGGAAIAAAFSTVAWVMDLHNPLFSANQIYYSKYSSLKHLTLALVSLGVFVFGFVLWNIDNHFCPHLREYRSSSPPLGIFTQFHAWWHLLAGMGTYLHLVVSSKIRMEYLKHPCAIKYICGLPYLEVSSPKM